MRTRFEVIEVRPETRRLLERLAKLREHEGVVPSVGAIVASLAEQETVRRAPARRGRHARR